MKFAPGELLDADFHNGNGGSSWVELFRVDEDYFMLQWGFDMDWYNLVWSHISIATITGGLAEFDVAVKQGFMAARRHWRGSHLFEVHNNNLNYSFTLKIWATRIFGETFSSPLYTLGT